MMAFGRRKTLYQHRADYEGVLGTSLEIQVGSRSKTAGREVEDQVLAEIDRLEGIFSVYRADSEFNLWQATRSVAVPVSSELAFVLSESEQWRTESNGAFLPVVEALTKVWRERALGALHDKLVDLDPSQPMWEVDLPALTATRLTEHPASLNAIAKGFIVDRCVEVAREVESVKQVLINIGGDLRHWGVGAAQVAVANPNDGAENSQPLCTVNLSNKAMATSGGYRRGFTVDGQRHSHIFDPVNMKPAINVKSVSCIAKTAMEADILATILGVLLPEEGLAFADRNDSVGAFVVGKTGNCYQNKAWEELRTPNRT